MKKIVVSNWHAFTLAGLLAIVIVAAVVLEPPTQKVHAASQFANIICDNAKPFSVSANTQLVTAGNANMFIYVCAYNISNGNAAAQAVSFVEGTGTTCATNTAAVVGNSTAAGGLTLGISGNINYGGGTGLVAKTAVAGDNLCIFTGAGPIGGVLSWTTAPF
jgi:hypothetical protein